MTIRFVPFARSGDRLWFVEGAEAEQGLERRQRRAASVVAKDEFVEVGLQVLGRDSAVGALQPGLEVGDRTVREWQHLVGRRVALTARSVVKSNGAQPRVAGPAVGVHDRAGTDRRAIQGTSVARLESRKTCKRTRPAPRPAPRRRPRRGRRCRRAGARHGAGNRGPTNASSTSTSALSNWRSGANIARRSLCKISHAVS
jgi:hypothetical protein